MKRWAIVLAAAVGLLNGGCVSSKQIIGPDGIPMYNISCDDNMHMISLADCYEKAGELCPGGYDILKIDERSKIQGSVFGATELTYRNMYVRCR